MRLAPRDSVTPAELHRSIVEERRDPMTKLKQIRAKLRGELSTVKQSGSPSSRIEEEDADFNDDHNAFNPADEYQDEIDYGN